MSEPLDDLRSALGAVEPSAGFERRTLRHIADSRTSRARAGRWLFTPVGAGAVVLVVIVSSRTANSGGGLGYQAALPTPTTVSAPLARVDAPVEHATKPAPRSVLRTRTVEAAWTIPPDAHPDQAIGMRRLMTLIRAVTARVPPNSGASDDNGPVPELAPIDLKPIVITPLPNGQGGGSEK